VSVGGDALAECVRAHRPHQDLHPCLEFVVAPAELVVDPQDRFEISQQVLLGQELVDQLADHRRATETAADQHLEACFSGIRAGGIAHDL
jgi:hypothetical protein